ncbi:MAG: Calx-beta domain-containing protein [Planktothrix sp. GU0601_MAG3]|nr:MAG: Calx-beta domain-containing protein [Planktothrix sp. GU0601_MAG3]
MLDIKTNLGFDLQQDFTFDPDNIRVTMSLEGQPEQTGILGDPNTKFTFQAPSEGCGLLEVEAKYELLGTVGNELGLTPRGSLDVKGLDVALDVNIGSYKFPTFDPPPLYGPKQFPEGGLVGNPISIAGKDAPIKLEPIDITTVGEEDVSKNIIIEKTYQVPYNLPISISDARVIEGNNGTTNAVFTVSLREASSEPLILEYSTSDSNAAAGSDYVQATNSSVTISAGQDTAEIIVPIIGDTAVESTETFTLTLKEPSGKLFAECEGVDSVSATGIITDDDEKEEPDPPEPNPHEFNDPRYITIDGKSLEFQAAGEFTLLESLNDDYKIQIRQQPVGNDPLKNASNATAVATILGGKRVGLYQDSQQLLIDGVPTTIPDNEYIFVGEGRIYREGNVYSFVYPKGDQLIATMTENRINVSLFLSPERRDTVRGIFGTYNDNPDDDLIKSDGNGLNFTHFSRTTIWRIC